MPNLPSSKTERVVEFTIGKQSSVRSHHGSTKLEHQSPIEIEPENFAIRFTRRVRHGRLK
jgi:hypothetical protein